MDPRLRGKTRSSATRASGRSARCGGRWRRAAWPLAPVRRARAARLARAQPTQVQATLRGPLSEQLLGRLARAGGTASRGWGPLEAAVHAAVFAWLPAGARRVQLAWDAGQREVVARFEIATSRADGAGDEAREP